jgi:hypothetical protein
LPIRQLQIFASQNHSSTYNLNIFATMTNRIYLQDYLLQNALVLGETDIESAAANAKQYEAVSQSQSSGYTISFSSGSIKKAAEKAKEKALLKADKIKKKLEKLGDSSPRRLMRGSVGASDKDARVDRKKRSESFEKPKPPK